MTLRFDNVYIASGGRDRAGKRRLEANQSYMPSNERNKRRQQLKMKISIRAHFQKNEHSVLITKQVIIFLN